MEKSVLEMIGGEKHINPHYDIKAEKRINELEKENERLKGDLELRGSGGCKATDLFECGVVKELKEQLTKATELLKQWLQIAHKNGARCYGFVKDTEQFLKEIEK